MLSASACMVEKTNAGLCLIKILLVCSFFAKNTFPLVRGTCPKLTFLGLLKIITCHFELNIVKLAETPNCKIH